VIMRSTCLPPTTSSLTYPCRKAELIIVFVNDALINERYVHVLVGQSFNELRC
jgi:hypothetical protein